VNRLLSRRRLAVGYASAAALALAACSVDQKREVATYREVLDRGIDHYATQSTLDQAELSVIDMMRLANQRSESLAIEGETYLQTLIDRRRAAAAFLPTVTLAPTYSWRDNTGSGDGLNGFGSGGSGGARGWNTPVDADLAVNPVRDLAAVRQAGATAREQQALLLDFQDTLLIDVARAHYEVIRAERQVEVLENSLRVQQERVNDARVRLQAGLVRPLDVTLSEAQAAQTDATLTQARVQAKTARSELAFLAAAPVQNHVLIDAVDVPADEPSITDVLIVALQFRQDVGAATRRIEAAEHLVDSAYGQYFPSVSLNFQWFLQRDSEPTDLDWTSVLQFSLPLFSAGLIEADVREALSILRQAKLNYSLAQRRVNRDVEVALENLLASFELIERVRVQVGSATEALEQSEALYQAGLATNLERLTAQNALLTAELDLINAELDSKVFYLDLRRTMGTLHELIGIERDPIDPRQQPGDDDAMVG
jgi:outer membrane protein TolC